jgi:predicted restriction endonuclease
MARNNKKFNKIKEIIKFIFDYRCAICNHTSLNNDLHHLDRNPNNNDVFNFVVLCKEHHRLIHRIHINIDKKPTPAQDTLLWQLALLL